MQQAAQVQLEQKVGDDAAQRDVPDIGGLHWIAALGTVDCHQRIHLEITISTAEHST